MNKLLLAFLLVLSPSAFGSIWYVDGVHGSDCNDCKTRQTACKTIGHAISLASWGDTIGVGPATYKENLTVSISLNIIGADASTTVVDGNQSGAVFTILAPAVLARLTIQNGYGGGYGGGIVNRDTLTLSMCTVTGNSVGAYSGGILNLQGTATVSMCTITGNTGYGNSGGIFNLEGTLVVRRSTITGNIMNGGYSGGIFNDEGTLTVNNSTITGNIMYGGYTGGIVNLEGTTTVNNSTITQNSNDSYGGGIADLEGFSTTVQNSILASNSPGNCYDAVTSEGYNLSDEDSCNFNGPGDMNNTEPLLGTLGNNGGPTQTIPELPGSPTIDAGNPTGCTNNNGPITIDQRGYPRPGKNKQDQRCDIGAYESQTD